MAEQVIIEFIGDTTNLEEAYNKLNAKIENSSGLNKESAAAFKNANADIASSFEHASDECKKFNEQLRNLNTIIAGGVLKNIVADLKAINKAQGDVADGAKDVEQKITALKAFALVGKSISANFALASDSLSLFDIKNDELEKTILKVQSAIKVVNDLQEVTNGLKSDGIILLKAESAATTVATAATEFFAEASTAAWGAATAGVTLAIAGVIKIIDYFQDLAKSERDRKAAEEDFSTLIEQENKQLERQIALKKALNIDTSGDEIAEIQNKAQKTSKSITDAQEKLNSYLKDKAVDLGFFGTDYAQKTEAELAKQNDKTYRELKKSLDEQVDLYKDQANEISVVKARLKDEQNKIDTEYRNQQELLFLKGFDREKKAFEQETKNLVAKDRADLQAAGYSEGDILDKQAQTRTIRRNQWNEIQRKHDLDEERKTIEAKLALAINGHSAEEELKQRIASEDNKNKSIQQNPNSSDADRKKADAEHTGAVNKLNADAAEKKYQFQKDADDRLSEAKIKSYQAQYDNEEKWSDKQLQLFDAKQKEELDIYIRDKAPMKAEADAFMAQQTAERDKWLAGRAKSNIKPTGNTLTPEQSGTDTAAKKLKEQQDLEKQIQSTAINFAKQTSDQIFALENQNRNNRYNAEISTLQKQAAFELNNNNLTQAQKLAIQRKFDKEQASVKLQQWKADQKSKEEQAIINGALAVANIMATMPWTTFGVAQGIAIASAVASTAVSVATIAAQKPPQFAKGTPKGTPVTPAGTKLVGEHGPELIYTPGGERIITAPDTAAILAKYDVPALPNVSPAIAMRANLNHAHPLINEDTLAKKIALEISKQTKPHLTFDKNGFTAHLINRGSKTTILNNKYKL